MLTWLALLTIAGLLVLILFRITSVFVALTLVPVAAALIGGFGIDTGTYAMDGMRSVAPIAALLAFAVIYFGIMNDAGLFEPFIRWLVGRVGRDPVKISLATAAIAAVAHLDGAGASTFMVTVPAMLPVYKAAGMSPLTLTCITALAAGTMNMLPWAGPASRAAAALAVGMGDLFVPLVPALIAGVIAVAAVAVRLGRQERSRLVRGRPPGPEPVLPAAALPRNGDPRAAPFAPARGPWWFNVLLTALTLVLLFTAVVPIAVVFLAAAALAVLVNYPDPQAQRERLAVHGNAAMMMVTTVFAAGVFAGILTKSGMLGALAADLVRVLPDAMLRHLPVLMGLAAMPLSLAFDPDSFYFGLLPVLAQASAAAGGSAVEVGRAALLGQMTTGFPVSPLTPSTFLLVGLAGVDLAEHQRRTIPYAFAVTVVMTVAALATGALAW